MKKILKWLMLPYKFSKFYKLYNNKDFLLLDVGCGNHSPSYTKKYFPKCHYHCIDINQNYNNNEYDLKCIEKFYKINLEETELLNQIPDNNYDVILMAHVIEHLSNGDEIIKKLTNKLKEGGKIYIEYPSLKSLSLPSMEGTLNFCDDSGHIRLYDVKEIANILLENNFKIISAGTRRCWRRIIFAPITFVRLLLNKKPFANLFWDITGFAQYVYAQKN